MALNNEAILDNAVARVRAPFLTAVWSHLLMVTFAAPDEAIQPYLPPGCEIDRWNGQGLCSLVAFDFLDTRVRGFGVRGFQDFPEWNLRVYVRYGLDRGVSFVREFVPNPAVALLARAVYNEPYRLAKFESRREQEGERFTVEHRIRVGGQWHSMGASARAMPIPAPEASIATFVKEQAWGFGRGPGDRLIRYRVEHPPWRIYPIEDYALAVDFADLYGPRWAFLQDQEPVSVLLCEGSSVTVYNREPG